MPSYVLPQAAANLSWLVRVGTYGAVPSLAYADSGSSMAARAFKGGNVLLIQVPSSPARSNSALLTDAYSSLRCACGVRAQWRCQTKSKRNVYG